MKAVYPDESFALWLTRMLAGGFTYHLFTNNVTPDRDTVAADLTEAAWTGYVDIDVDDTDFGMPSVAGHIGAAVAPDIAFVNASGGSQSAYGYYVTAQGDTEILLAVRFDSAPVAQDDGDSWLVTPRVGSASKEITA